MASQQLLSPERRLLCGRRGCRREHGPSRPRRVSAARSVLCLSSNGQPMSNGQAGSEASARQDRPIDIAGMPSNHAAPSRVGTSSSEAANSLDSRIASGEFTDIGSTKERMSRPVRRALAGAPLGLGRSAALELAKAGRRWRAAAAGRMPEARGDIREIVNEPVFLTLYKLFLAYGPIFRLSFGPKSFVVVSDPALAKQVLLTNADRYSKGLLAEILDFVMGKGLIPADGEIWKTRRRALVPSLHRRYIASMVNMFGESTLHGMRNLQAACERGQAVEMENWFSRHTLDIIGKAVFDYDFDSLTHDNPVIQAVYTVLREAEYRSTQPIPYWNVPLLRWLVPRQRRCTEALQVVNATLDGLIARCKALVASEDQDFEEEFVGEQDPSILHFLLASGEQISSKQLRDDLMTMLIAGHETTAAVLTWTLHCCHQHPQVMQRMQAEIDSLLGDRKPTIADIQALRYTTRVINESMRLYPQPPVLIRRVLKADVLAGYSVAEGSDMFISAWNLHRSPALWANPHDFNPDRFPVDGPVPSEVTENFAYLPFGGGRRKCIGDQFALFEAVVSLAMLVRRFDFRMAPDAPPVSMTTGATIHTSHGLLMEVIPRQGQAQQQDAGAQVATARQLERSLA